jgi:hypothetical protein
MRRVGALSAHLAATAAPAAGSVASELGEADPKLLTDAQIIQFIKSGFVILPLTELSPEFHAQCAASIMQPWDKHARNNNWVGNNIFPANPNLGAMLATPTVRGALTSVLGPEYAMHAHRALHVSGNGDQGFHKDTPEGGGPVKHMRPRWCMIMYYPAGSTLEMGPTCILPGGQYFSTDPDKWGQVAESMGAALGLSEFKVTTPLAQGTGKPVAHPVQWSISSSVSLPLTHSLGHRSAAVLVSHPYSFPHVSSWKRANSRCWGVSARRL